MSTEDKVRLDKWLWAARLYRTRSLAAEAIRQGKVRINDLTARASREPVPGDRIVLRRTGQELVLTVRALSAIRGPAPVAQTLYEEDPASVARRAREQEARRQGVEPAASRSNGRPTARQRRHLASWQRWSASAED
ncbi:MAG: RNA-binding S4 domain-containing protein [Rubrivivax sp.]